MEANDDKLDTTIELITPENIVFRYYLAGPAHRALAFAVDCICQFAIFMATSFALVILSVYFPVLEDVFEFFFFISIFLIFWLYGGILEAVWNGRTLGKWVFGLRVVTVEGLPITPFQALMRNLLRAADLQPFFTGWVGLLAMLLSPRFQRVGDLACKTMVIIDRVSDLKAIPLADQPDIARIAKLLPARVEFHPSVVRALLMYVHRREWLSWDRRNEIAAPLAEALKQRYGLPADVSPDVVLCAAYQKSVLGMTTENDENHRLRAASLKIDSASPIADVLTAELIGSSSEIATTKRRE
ncbi:MAG: RDD family protein [Thermogutta sp.]